MSRSGHEGPAGHGLRPEQIAAAVGAGPGAEAPGGPVQATPAPGWGGSGWFVGSVLAGPGRRRVILRGDIGVVALDRLARHLRGLVRSRVRHIMVDATEVRRCDPLVAQLLGRSQHQFSACRGLITVIGLPPGSCLTAKATPVVPDPRRAEHDMGHVPAARARDVRPGPRGPQRGTKPPGRAGSGLTWPASFSRAGRRARDRADGTDGAGRTNAR